MTTSDWQDKMHIEFQDITAFKAAIAASLSLANARMLGYEIDGFTEMPSFDISVDGEVKAGYVSGVTVSGSYVEDVVIYFHGPDDDMTGMCHYVGVRAGDSDDWDLGATIITDTLKMIPQFAEHAISDQLILLHP